MGLMGLLMAPYGGLKGILSGLTKSTDHPSIEHETLLLTEGDLIITTGSWGASGARSFCSCKQRRSYQDMSKNMFQLDHMESYAHPNTSPYHPRCCW